MGDIMAETSTNTDDLKDALMFWVGDEHAVQWLMDVDAVFQFFDDIIDDDKERIQDDQVIDILFRAVVDMPFNPFFNQYPKILLLALRNAIVNYHTSVNYEHRGSPADLEMSFVLRQDYLNVVKTVVELVRGRGVMLDMTVNISQHGLKTESMEKYKEKIIRRNS